MEKKNHRNDKKRLEDNATIVHDKIRTVFTVITEYCMSPLF